MIRTFHAMAAAAAALFAAGAFAATDLNTASRADLEALRGIGPVQAGLILDAREKGPFQSWSDFKARVRGVGPTASQRYSEAGLTINGAAYRGSSRTGSAKRTAAAKPGYGAEAKQAAKDGAAEVGPGFRRMGEGVKQMGRDVKESVREQGADIKAGASETKARATGASSPAR